jgi:threonine aldolase
MDGARFANALVRLGCSPADMTWRAGVDILSFGATKNGAMAAEAIVAFDPRLAESLEHRRKRSGHTLSKGRFLAAQLEGYLADDHWLENAGRANVMAARLAVGLAEIPGVRLAWEVQANEVFPVLPASLDAALRNAGAVYHPWYAGSLPEGERVGEGEALVRLVCSFATTQAEVERFLDAARGASRAAA